MNSKNSPLKSKNNLDYEGSVLRRNGNNKVYIYS